MSHHNHHDMAMHFHWSTEVKWFLFEFWKVETLSQYIFALLFTFILAIANHLLFWILVQKPWTRTKVVVFISQVTVSYALMLILMTYNIGLSLALLAGCSIGYTLFSTVAQAIVDSFFSGNDDKERVGLSEGFEYHQLAREIDFDEEEDNNDDGDDEERMHSIEMTEDGEHETEDVHGRGVHGKIH